MNDPKTPPDKPATPPVKEPVQNPPEKLQEFGGRGGLEPTRYGDWESGGRCTDF